MSQVKSVWNKFSNIYGYSSLHKNITVDVAIIGGGITGISVSKLLAEEGVKSTVLESRTVGASTTSHSTGNLYSTIDSNLTSIKSKYDLDTVKSVVESRTEALEQMGKWIQTYEIDCDFKKVPMYLYSSDEKTSKKIRSEIDTCKEINLQISEVGSGEIYYPTVEALKIEGQAQINPMSYVQGLAKSLNPEVSQVYEQTHVSSVEEENGTYTLKTSGGTVTANKVIHATHTPKGIKFVQTLLGPYREYGIACRIEEPQLSEGIFWGYHSPGKKFSTRIYNRDGNRFLIVVGEPHKVGTKEQNEQCLQELEKFARTYFDIQEVNFRWGGQHYRPADLLPYIGPRHKKSGEYIATGYATDGLVYGTMAGRIITDQITGRENRWVKIYSATRNRPAKAAKKFLKENLHVAGHYIKEIVNFPKGKLEEINTGEGKIITHNGDKLAVSRNGEGELEVVSAICSHMGCTVQWNQTEKSWDCPCHGSRFHSNGSVLEGPAFHPLNE